MCVDNSKEGVGNNVDSADRHLTYLTQDENNVNLGGCDKHLTHVVKNTPESLLSEGGGLKDDSDSIDNSQKDNDEKIMETQTIK
eukprot:10807016-Ditylum_brightwellii.AAC.1